MAKQTKKVVGITGGVGAGKTTLLKQMQKFGFLTVTADRVGREVAKKGSPVLRALVATFGKTVLAPSGELDRKKVGHWVFQNPTALNRLNCLTHPYMRLIIDATVRELRGKGAKLIAIEAAVLFEMGLNRMVNEVWVVTASFKERLRRMEKAGWKRQTTWWRMVRQLPDEMFIRRAHRVIVTYGKFSLSAAKPN